MPSLLPIVRPFTDSSLPTMTTITTMYYIPKPNNIEIQSAFEPKSGGESKRHKKAKWIHHMIDTSSGSHIKLTNILDTDPHHMPANTIDIISRYLFPIAFIVCVFFYILYLYVL
ncbi:unnamed protein product [Medioppia subpectinata]|uniref:Uncharacterized protein n=1 Tax=Medioppia subpectinata TaxID=1979941 RepID=A0A7R9KZP0_9ACAR|nr:unnamed protein product [Medioppia subpectinata]CAG2112530.1 unnamed protein product [Medioppia subpectinata]